MSFIRLCFNEMEMFAYLSIYFCLSQYIDTVKALWMHCCTVLPPLSVSKDKGVISNGSPDIVLASLLLHHVGYMGLPGTS